MVYARNYNILLTMSRILNRVLIFLIPFSIIFVYIHEQFETVISRSTISGLAGFYSTAGIIFGLVVAFVIQREWEAWRRLSESVQSEIDSVREMWKWSGYTEPSLCKEAHRHLEEYLKIIDAEWEKGEHVNRSKELDAELDSLRGMLVEMSSYLGSTSVQLQEAFTNLVAARNQRLSFSNEHMPGILKRVVVFADTLLIFLSLFVAVNNIYLDYIFTASISLLAFVLFLVVDDLDNPFRPGTWHLTSEGYRNLLQELTVLDA